MKLYGNPYSRANRVRWALEASGAQFEEETLSLDQDGTGSQRYRAINPNGLVPAIDDNGLILFESIPICLYIAKKYAPDTLYVDSIKDEALLLQWSVWAMTELEKHNETASLHLTWYPESKRDAKVALNDFPHVKRYLQSNLSQPSAQKAFEPDILQPYLA